MSLNTSKIILKVTGIISIILGILLTLLGILSLVGGGFVGLGLSADTANLSAETLKSGSLGMSLLVFFGFILLVVGILALLDGIFAVRAAKDISKIMPAWVFSIINLILCIISFVMLFVNNSSPAISDIALFSFSLALSILVFVSATIIKKNATR